MIVWIIIPLLVIIFIVYMNRQSSTPMSSTPMSSTEGFDCPKRWTYEPHKGVIGNSVPPRLTIKPEGLDKYPPPSLPPQGAPQPPVWKWKPYVNYYYYDPYFDGHWNYYY